MKRLISVILIAALVLGCFAACAPDDTADSSSKSASSVQGVSSEANASSQGTSQEESNYLLPFSKGVNVSGMDTFLSDNQWGIFEKGMKTLTDEFTYTNIKSQGFDHIRVPANFFTIFYEAEDYGYTTEQLMKCIDTAIEFSEKHGLYIVLDFHGWFYIGEEKNDIEEFLYCWTQVANRYKDYSDNLIFELLNEPWYTNGRAQPYLSDSQLNKMQADAIKIIRDTGSKNKNRLIICCTADGNKAWKLDQLVLPEDDNLAVAIHEYEPTDFTGQGFTWAGYEHGKQIRLSDVGGLTKANWDFRMIENFMAKTGIPVVLNEFGLNLDLAHDDDVNAYLRGIAEFCEMNGIPWAYWHYDGGDFKNIFEWSRRDGEFALYRELNSYKKMEWDKKALDALFLR